MGHGPASTVRGNRRSKTMPETCADCGAVFAEPSDLLAHMRTAHRGGDAAASLASNPYSETPGFTCALCGATFNDPRALAAHDLHPHARARRSGRPRPSSA